MLLAKEIGTEKRDREKGREASENSTLLQILLRALRAAFILENDVVSFIIYFYFEFVCCQHIGLLEIGIHLIPRESS